MGCPQGRSRLCSSTASACRTMSLGGITRLFQQARVYCHGHKRLWIQVHRFKVQRPRVHLIRLQLRSRPCRAHVALHSCLVSSPRSPDGTPLLTSCFACRFVRVCFFPFLTNCSCCCMSVKTDLYRVKTLQELRGRTLAPSSLDCYVISVRAFVLALWEF